MLRILAMLMLVTAALTAGCAQPPQAPEAPPQAEEPPAEPSASVDPLYDRISGYATWAPAPDYAEPAPAKGPHGEQVRIFMDPTAEAGYFKAAESSLGYGHTWPEGSIIVKEILSGGEIMQLAAMEKTADGWYWGEWTAEGEPVVEEGVGVEPCEGCHSHGGSDGTLGVLLTP